MRYRLVLGTLAALMGLSAFAFTGEGRILEAPALSAHYTGPLFSAHEHLGLRPGRTVAQDADYFAGTTQEQGISRIVAFACSRLTQRPDQPERDMIAAAAGPDDPFVPLWCVLPSDFSEAPAGLRRVFSEGPFWLGTGEWALYLPQYRPGQLVHPDDPVMLQVYDIVAEFDRTVMVHPACGPAAREGLKRALAHNRNTPFLVHGYQEGLNCAGGAPFRPLQHMDLSGITSMLESEPNYWFDLSATQPHALEPRVDGVDRKVHLRQDLDAHVEEALRFYGPMIDAFPDRILLGWDSGNLVADYDREWLALGVEFYRKLLGRIDAKTAEKMARLNAERLLLRIPILEAPAPQQTLAGFGTALSWVLPPNTTQVHLQVTPANNDGPAINLIRGSATDTFDIPAPAFGDGPYLMLPGMTYSWRVRTGAATRSIDENSPSWRPWSEARMFRTPTRGSERLTPISPASGSTVPGGTHVLQWDNEDRDVFYYEIQVSIDRTFELDPERATAPVWWNLVHGGVSSPPNTWTTPDVAPGATYFWRVRPRVQGDGTAVPWAPVWSFTAR